MIDYPDELNMHLFGAPRLVQTGREVHLRRRKMYGLLAYLAFEKRQFHRVGVPPQLEYIRKALEKQG